MVPRDDQCWAVTAHNRHCARRPRYTVTFPSGLELHLCGLHKFACPPNAQLTQTAHG